MSRNIFRSPLRPYFHYIHMPTCDSDPQQNEWVADFLTADGIFTYSHWAEGVLKKQGGDHIKMLGANPPGVNSNIFKPLDKDQVRKSIGIDPKINIIGTVMRNQKRKLFPDLINSFKVLLDKFKKNGQDNLANNTYLYLHTAFPDLGWELPKLIQEAGVYNRVWFTYICHKPNCQTVFPSTFQGVTAPCKKCKDLSARMARPEEGVNQQTLNVIMNLFDIYAQLIIAAGQEIPIIEASLAGTPVVYIDCAAAKDFKSTIKAHPIKPLKLMLEMETAAYRAVSDNDAFVEKIYKMLQQPKSVLRDYGKKSHKLAVEKYDWEKCVRKWIVAINSVNHQKIAKNWNSPAKVFHPKVKIPDVEMRHSEFLKLAFNYILGQPEKINKYFFLRLLRDLNYGRVAVNDGIAYSEDALSSHRKFKGFNRQEAVNLLKQMRNNINQWEQIRTGMIKHTSNCVKFKHSA